MFSKHIMAGSKRHPDVRRPATLRVRNARIVIWLAVMLLGGLSPLARGAQAASPAGSAGLRLVMIEEEGCGYCMRWLSEVGQGYPLSDEGRQAPLLRIDRFSDDASRYARVVYTPTFVLERDGQEVGRILGYPGAQLFWWQLSDMIAKHEEERAKGTAEPARKAP